MEHLRNEREVGIQILHDSDGLIALSYADDVIDMADNSPKPTNSNEYFIKILSVNRHENKFIENKDNGA